MSLTHVFSRCMHPDLESARTVIWDRPNEDGRIAKQPESVGQLHPKAKWEKLLAGLIVATGAGLLGPACQTPLAVFLYEYLRGTVK
jgi:hypothetical protein